MSSSRRLASSRGSFLAKASLNSEFAATRFRDCAEIPGYRGGLAPPLENDWPPVADAVTLGPVHLCKACPRGRLPPSRDCTAIGNAVRHHFPRHGAPIEISLGLRRIGLDIGNTAVIGLPRPSPSSSAVVLGLFLHRGLGGIGHVFFRRRIGGNGCRWLCGADVAAGGWAWSTLSPVATRLTANHQLAARRGDRHCGRLRRDPARMRRFHGGRESAHEQQQQRGEHQPLVRFVAYDVLLILRRATQHGRDVRPVNRLQIERAGTGRNVPPSVCSAMSRNVSPSSRLTTSFPSRSFTNDRPPVCGSATSILLPTSSPNPTLTILTPFSLAALAASKGNES